MRALQADAKDNVAVVVQDVAAGDEVTVTEILRVKVREDIPVGHKIAITDLLPGDHVVKYGVPIGEAAEEIKEGMYVHTHNVKDITEQLCKEYAEEFRRKAGEISETDI